MANSKRGFTLIELLVVIAIIALLMSILMPALGMAKEQAQNVMCRTNFRSIGLAIYLYCTENDGVASIGSGGNGASIASSASVGSGGSGAGVARSGDLMTMGDPLHPYVAYRGDKKWANGPGGRTAFKLGVLYEAGLIDTGEIFYCPSNRREGRFYESYTSPAPWGTLPQDYNTLKGNNNWVRTGCSYYPRHKRAKQTIGGMEFPAVAENQDDLCSSLSMVTDDIWNWNGISHTKNGQPRGFNALFGDGHVTFTIHSNPPQISDGEYSGVLDYDLWYDSSGVGRTIRPQEIYFHIILGLLKP